MAIKGRTEGFKGIVGIMSVAAALAGCGGSQSDSAASASTTASSILATGNSLGPTMNSGVGAIALSEVAYQATAASSAVVTVYRSGTGKGGASAEYHTIDGSAVAGTDYGATSGTLTWNDGDVSARTVIIPVGASANGKAFAITLADAGGRVRIGNPASAMIQVAPGTTGGSGSGSSSSSSGGGSSSGSGSSGGGSSSSSGVGPSGGSSSGSGSSGGGSSSSGVNLGTKTATLSWTAPSENTNGTALTNLAGYNIYYGNSTGAMTNQIRITTPGIQTYVIDNLTSGSWYFAITALNSTGVESVASGTVKVTL